MKNPPYGILAILAASLIWGLSGLFYKALAHVPPLEVLSHRTLWSMLIFGVVLAFRGRLAAVWRASLWLGNRAPTSQHVHPICVRRQARS